MLRYIRNVKWEMADIVPDFLLGRRAAAVFISLRFHRLKPGYETTMRSGWLVSVCFSLDRPERVLACLLSITTLLIPAAFSPPPSCSRYLYSRLRELQRSFRLRIVLVHVDIKDPVAPLEEISKLTVFNEATLVCGFSPEECGRILETYKAFENKSADTIQEKTEQDYMSRLTSVMTTVRGVNRADALRLGEERKSVAGIFSSDKAKLQKCNGIGDRKVQRLHDAFHLPFRLSTQKAAEERLARADGRKSAPKGTDEDDKEEEEETREKMTNGKKESPSESEASDFEVLEV